tara:strand:+ start:3417 stop:3761 length:345 start_codon:yes stop_codon:yes gene_type:complete
MKFNLSTAKDIKDFISKLTTGLGKLTFEDNMESFIVEDIEIRSGKTVTIRNELTFVPSKYIIVSQEGHGLVTKGKERSTNSSGSFAREVDWNTQNVYLKNHGPNTVTLTVVFMR